MTRLEEEIKAAMVESQLGLGGESILMQVQAKAAAEVAKKYIEKAFHENPYARVQELCGMTNEEELWQEFTKDNGVTE